MKETNFEKTKRLRFIKDTKLRKKQKLLKEQKIKKSKSFYQRWMTNNIFWIDDYE